MDAATPGDPTTPDDTDRRSETPGSAQLRLLETRPRPEWRLDDSTREVGRRGVAAARAALRSARRRTAPDAGGDGHGRSTAA